MGCCWVLCRGYSAVVRTIILHVYISFFHLLRGRCKYLETKQKSHKTLGERLHYDLTTFDLNQSGHHRPLFWYGMPHLLYMFHINTSNDQLPFSCFFFSVSGIDMSCGLLCVCVSPPGHGQALWRGLATGLYRGDSRGATTAAAGQTGDGESKDAGPERPGSFHPQSR